MLAPRRKRIVEKDAQAPGTSLGAYPVRPQRRDSERALDSAHDVH
jgi:hypothetical protein